MADEAHRRGLEIRAEMLVCERRRSKVENADDRASGFENAVSGFSCTSASNAELRYRGAPAALDRLHSAAALHELGVA